MFLTRAVRAVRAAPITTRLSRLFPTRAGPGQTRADIESLYIFFEYLAADFVKPRSPLTRDSDLAFHLLAVSV